MLLTHEQYRILGVYIWYTRDEVGLDLDESAPILGSLYFIIPKIVCSVVFHFSTTLKMNTILVLGIYTDIIDWQSQLAWNDTDGSTGSQVEKEW